MILCGVDEDHARISMQKYYELNVCHTIYVNDHGILQERARKEREELDLMLEENRRRVEESQRREALELQRKEEERQRELEMIQRQKEEAARRKKLEEEEEHAKRMNSLSKNKSRPKSFGL